MPVKTVLQTVQDTLKEEMQRDSSVVVLGEDVGVMGGVFRTTKGLIAEFGDERVIDTPLSEIAIIGVAIGMAANGMHPVAEIQFADFIFEASDQIISEASKMRYRSNGDFNCPMVIRTPAGGGVHGGLYHSQNIEALFSHVPGLKIVYPYVPSDVKGLLKSAIRSEDPVLFLEPKKAYRHVKGEVPDGDYTIPIGKADIKRPGSRLALITYGPSVGPSLEAASLVEKEGLDVEVLDLRTVRPLDHNAILETARKTGRVLIVHEDSKMFGIGAEVAAIIAEEAFDHLDAPVMRIGAPEVPAMPFSPPMEEFCIPSSAKIADALRKLAAY